MARQFRGVSEHYVADYKYDATTGKVTFGTPTKYGETKSISREISSESEEVWADNKLNDTTFGGTSVTRTFTSTRLDPAVEAHSLGNTVYTDDTSGLTVYGTAQDGSNRPYQAHGYALHDGDANKPCLLVWCFKGMTNSISQVSNTIDRGTGSEGQESNITFSAPDAVWEKTGKADLDITLAVTEKVTAAMIKKWFAQVVTYDNLATVFAPANSGSGS